MNINQQIQEVYHLAGSKTCGCCAGKGEVQNSEAIGKEIRARREAAGLIIAEVAKRVNLKPRYLHLLEEGEKFWYTHDLREVLKALDPAWVKTTPPEPPTTLIL